MSEMVPMTKEAYNRLRAEIEHLEAVEMPIDCREDCRSAGRR